VGIPFSFHPETHICYDTRDGSFVPTVTQVLELTGLAPSFKKLVQRGILAQDTLDRRSWVGREVHDLTDTLDQDNEINPLHLCEDTAGYVQSWVGFKELTGFIPEAWSVRYCEAIAGMPLSGELDVYGTFPGPRQTRVPAIVDKKTGSSASDSWAFQTAAYEMLRYCSPKIGRVLRVVAHLKKDGSPGLALEYGEVSPVDGVSYADGFLAALHCVHIGIRRGYISERDVID
jgi:hypothetical protein